MASATKSRSDESINRKIYNSKKSEVSVTSGLSIFRNRRSINRASIFPKSKGRPFSSELFIRNGIIPHPVISTNVLEIFNDIFAFLEWTYKADPMVSNAIENYVAYATSGGYRVVLEENPDLANKIEKWMRINHINHLNQNVFRCLYLFGNVFIWKDFRKFNGKRGRPKKNPEGTITDARVIHPQYMFVQLDKYGDVKGYWQKRSIDDENWRFFSPNEIIHMKLRSLADRAYSVGLIEPMLRDLHYERYAEHTVAEIFHDYLAPLLHIKCGMEKSPAGGQRPASEQSVNSVREQIENLAPNQDLVTDNQVNIDLIQPSRSIGDYKSALDQFRTNAIMGSGLPHFMFGIVANITEASAVVMKEIIERRVATDQSIVSSAYEVHLLPYILVDEMRNSVNNYAYEEYGKEFSSKFLNRFINIDNIRIHPQLEWNPIESFRERSERLLKELNSGGITINEYRKDYGRDKIDHEYADLPIPIIQFEMNLQQLELQRATFQFKKDTGAEQKKKKGERTPEETKPNTDTVDETGQPKAKDAKTHRRK